MNRDTTHGRQADRGGGLDRRQFLGRTIAVVMGIRALDGAVVEEAFVEVVDSMGAVHPVHTMSLMDDILKQYYLPVAREQLNSPSLLLGGWRE